ncbi:MAG: hypothetical protein KGJ05_05630 [Alphaproteobacteria bacterium]|nr:hypothetical protein [Alphaproteobacteria bacterium]MDE2340932.1 hypothetical protein [Alphaproteobacteria bacterium]
MLLRASLPVFVALTLGGALAGCTPSSHYAPLRPRAEENDALPRQSHALPEWIVRPATEDTNKIVRDARAQADVGQTAFMQNLASTRHAIQTGRNQPIGSDAWLNMEESLAALNESRSPTQRAASALDNEIMAAYEGDGAGLNAYQSARDMIGVLLAAQDQQLGVLNQQAHDALSPAH